MTFNHQSVEVMCDSTQGSLCLSPMKIYILYIKVCGYSDPFFHELGRKVIDTYMTFDPTFVEVTCVTLPKDHFIQVP